MLEAFDFMLLRYSHCLFDFDGTVADTGDGITRSVAYSLEKMRYPALPEATLSRFIGPPLHDSYKEYCGMTDEESDTSLSGTVRGYWTVRISPLSRNCSVATVAA